MAYSLTVAALLHPWSGRLEIVCSLPPYRNERTTFDNKAPKTDKHPVTTQKHERKQKSLSIELPWLLNVAGDEAVDEVPEEEDTISTTGTESDASSSDETTCEYLDNMSEMLGTTATDGHTLQEDALDALVELTMSETAEAKVKAEAEEEAEEAGEEAEGRPTPPPVRKQSPSAEFQNGYFQVAKSSVAGWGAFATRDLKRGDIILREIPLFVAESDNIIREYFRLDGRDREFLTRLNLTSQPASPRDARLTMTMRRRSFAIGHHVAGLFPIAARFNHACSPVDNVGYRFDGQEGALEMVARRDVAAGRELTISYGKNLSPELLYSCYGFRCGCGGCEGLSERDIELFESMQWYS
ncbi:hypothetical protein J3F83DRAFT_712517 [Trichoderma novae-zelandiae]